MIDPKRHADNRGLIESVLRYVPGFRGYLEKDYRQEGDYLVRRWIADRLQRSKRALDEAMMTLVEAGRIDQLPVWERLKTRLDALILRCRSSVRGYSGFFDFVQVDITLLERVYEHDLALVQQAETLAAAIERAGGADAAPHELLQQIDALDRLFSQRAELLGGLRDS